MADNVVRQGVTVAAGKENIRLPLLPAELTEPLTDEMKKYLLGPVLAHLTQMMEAYTAEHAEEFQEWMLELPELQVESDVVIVRWDLILFPTLRLTKPWKRRITDDAPGT